MADKALRTIREQQEAEFISTVEKSFSNYDVIRKNSDSSYYYLPVEGLEAFARKFYQMGKDHNQEEWRLSLLGDTIRKIHCK